MASFIWPRWSFLPSLRRQGGITATVPAFMQKRGRAGGWRVGGLETPDILATAAGTFITMS